MRQVPLLLVALASALSIASAPPSSAKGGGALRSHLLLRVAGQGEDLPARSEVQARLEQAQGIEVTEGDERTPLLIQLYLQTLGALDAYEESLAAATELQAKKDAAPERMAQLEATLDGPVPVDGTDYGALTLAELTQKSIDAELEVARAQETLQGLEDMDTAMVARREEATLLGELEAKIDGLEEQLALGFADEGVELRSAREANAQAELAAARARAAELRLRSATFDVRRDVLALEIRVARRVLKQKSAAEERVFAALSDAQEVEAEAKKASALATQMAAAMESPRFQEISDRAVELRSETVELVQALETGRIQLAELDALESELEDRYDYTRERISIDGLSTATGLHLREERLRFLDARSLEAQAAQDRARKNESSLKQFYLEQELNKVRDEVDFVQGLVDSAGPAPKDPDKLNELAQRLKQEYLTAIRDQKDLLRERTTQLLDIAKLRTSIIVKQAEYEDYVAERVLWIRSHEPIWKVRPADLVQEATGALSPTGWYQSLKAFLRDLGGRPFTAMGVLLGLLVLLGARLRSRKALAEEGELARQRSQVSIAPTLRAALLSLLVAAPFAAVLVGLAWLAGTVQPGTEYLGAIADACHRAAAAALIIGALRALTAKDGLAEAHFDAAPEAVRLVRRHTNWLLPVMPTAALIGEFTASLDSSSNIDALARIAFLVEVGSLLVFTWIVLSPGRGILAMNARSAGSDDWLTRLRRLWFTLAVLLTGFLFALVVAGYGFTARNLFGKLQLTIALILALTVVRSIGLRWIRLIRRREALEKLRKKREELRAKRLAEIERRRNAGEDYEELESEGLEVEKEEISVAALSSDLKSLIRMGSGLTVIGGAYWIWSSVLPALGVFDRVRLWQHETSILDGSGVASMTTEWVTLGNVGLAALILLVTWRAVSDLPSLLEIILLRRLELGSGERYAITTLLRYLLTTIGIIAAFNELGLSWSKLQWLVAGVSVGLGFGLQEIFANFVSGITLLFERPVRVGDWVTLGDIEGVVSKIRIRATTIRDRDLKELIVPNREFITGRFINWTLSDPVSRVTAQVGIAYGSDTERAIQLLLEAGRDCNYSVAEPAPNVVFTGFGASSLDFELRVFVTGREIKPRVQHDLHLRIDAAFRRAEIEISFPQRDLHIRTAPGLEGLRPETS